MRKSLTMLAVIGGVVASAVALGPSAAADVGIQACERTTIYTGPPEGVGTEAIKSSTSTCNDLNLVYAQDTSGGSYDYYAGRYYKSSTRQWITGSAGFIFAPDGSYELDQKVLVTDLRDGTKFTVASWFDGPDYVIIAH